VAYAESTVVAMKKEDNSIKNEVAPKLDYDKMIRGFASIKSRMAIL